MYAGSACTLGVANCTVCQRATSSHIVQLRTRQGNSERQGKRTYGGFLHTKERIFPHFESATPPISRFKAKKLVFLIWKNSSTAFNGIYITTRTTQAYQKQNRKPRYNLTRPLTFITTFTYGIFIRQAKNVTDVAKKRTPPWALSWKKWDSYRTLLRGFLYWSSIGMLLHPFNVLWNWNTCMWNRICLAEKNFSAEKYHYFSTVKLSF